MAITDRIESMYDHVEEVYDTITNVELNLGKNLFDISNATGTINGLTFSQYDGVLTINGTATQETNVDLNTVEGTGDTYSLSSIVVNPNGSGVGYIQVYNGETVVIAKSMSSTSSSSGTLASGTTYTNRLNISNGQTYNNFQLKIQLEKGEEATPYQPYTDTPDYKNIENIPKIIKKSYLNIMNEGSQEIWDNWDKVNGSGETVSLSNTESAPMSLAYKGNTYQYSSDVAGKNLFNFNSTSYTRNGSLEITDDTLKISCTLQDNNADVWWGIDVSNYTGNVTISYDSLVEGASGTDNNLSYCFMSSIPTNWNNMGALTVVDKTNKYATTALGGGNYLIIVLQAQHGNAFVDGWASVSEVQVELGSTPTSYERFAGATPTPSLPSPVQIVSGDNNIKVEGKNLFDGTLSSGYYLTSTKTLTDTTNTIYKSFEIDIKAGTYTLSCNTNINMIRAFTDYNNSSDAIFSETTMNVKSYVMNITQDTKLYISVRRNDNTSWLESDLLQLEKGNQATTYEAYNGANYPINLGYENLIDKNIYNIVGTAPNNYLGIDISNLVIGQQYTFSSNQPIKDFKISNSKGGYGSIENYVANGFYTFTFTMARDSHISESSTQYLFLQLAGESDFVKNITQLNNYNLQIEKGSVAHTYTPYGVQPIELCKIGTYQDKIDKSTGINKLAPTQDFTETKNGLTFTGHNGIYTISGTASASTYSTAYNVANYTIQEGDYLHMKNSIALSGAEIDITFTDNTMATPGLSVANRIWSLSNYVGKTIAKITFYVSNGLTTNFYLTPMILNTSMATDFEPYGTGWYLKKEIGKYTFTGNETWFASAYGTNSWAIANLITFNHNENYVIVMSNIFKGIPAKDRTLEGSNVIYTGDSNTITVRNTSFTTLSEVRSATSGKLLYYVLPTPTYETITDTTLIGQLEALKKSYESVTNISQVNNDMPFELDVVALSDGTVSTLSLGSPLLGSMSTQEEPETLEEVLEEPEEEPIEEETE